LAGYALDLARASPHTFAPLYAAFGAAAFFVLLRMNSAGRCLGIVFLLLGLRSAFLLLTENVVWTWVWVSHVSLYLADAALVTYLLLPSTGRRFARLSIPTL
jgi:hypothetical protein